ncbi:hypothetical protein CDAR_229001 [Caerostris darwini]|uniref:Uncharacterized protein n=1 Tax=Caerostris darwini TaxID=1538125 RepID=A0AAV4RJ39_9ARAC|nr:hypothetical protein CDAR_229001 [Caerostris darwini]
MHNLDSSFHPSWEEMGPQKPHVIKKSFLIQSPCCSQRERDGLDGIQCIVDLECMFDWKKFLLHFDLMDDGMSNIDSSFHPSWEEMGPQKPNMIKKSFLIRSLRERERDGLDGIQYIVDLECMFDGKVGF